MRDSVNGELWEQGSEFHWIDCGSPSDIKGPWEGRGNYYGSGRDALRALIQFGRETRKWRRLVVPSYFCQDVLSSLLSTGVDIKPYSANPISYGRPGCVFQWEKGDVLLRINFFGLGLSTLPEGLPSDVETIVDHTHDPWSTSAFNGASDWAVASLRKTLPLPCGGVLWSPTGKSLPPPVAVTGQRTRASVDKLAAMLLKAEYLAGGPVEKAKFRRLQLSGEQGIAAGPVSGMPDWVQPLVSSYPVYAWRVSRSENHQRLRGNLAQTPWLTVLSQTRETGDPPFSGILLFDSRTRRDAVFRGLIKHSVYPAILWPLETTGPCRVSDEDFDFSRRMISLHCDARYQISDIDRVSQLVLQAGDY